MCRATWTEACQCLMLNLLLVPCLVPGLPPATAAPLA